MLVFQGRSALDVAQLHWGDTGSKDIEVRPTATHANPLYTLFELLCIGIIIPILDIEIFSAMCACRCMWIHDDALVVAKISPPLPFPFVPAR